MNTVVIFTASWCGPCQSMKPVFEALKDTVVIPVLHLDVDEYPNAAGDYGVRMVPTVILVDDAGNELERHSGTATLVDYEQMLERHDL